MRFEQNPSWWNFIHSLVAGLGLFIVLMATTQLGLAAPSLEAGPVPARVTIIPDQTYQEIDGFGTCIVNYDMLPSYRNPDFYDRVVFDLGLNILRLPLDGIEADFNDNEDPRQINWESIEKGPLRNVMEIARQYQVRGVDHIMATPWSPPAWMKTNRSVTTGGRLRPDMRDEFAENLEIWATAAMRLFNLRIDAVSIQNEPLFAQTFSSCVYNPVQMARTFEVVRERFAGQLPETGLVLSEDMGWADRFVLYLEPLMANPENRDFKGFFASHGWNGLNNWRKMAELLQPYGHRLWMTETSGHPPDWPGALALAENIHDTLAGGNVSAFIYWQIEAGEPSRWALLNQGEYTPKAYAMQHFSRLVRPGYVRVHAFCTQKELLVSAYTDRTSGLVSLVMVNPGSESYQAEISPGEDLQPENWISFTSREGDYFRQGSVDADSGCQIPPYSVVSLVGRANDRIDHLPSLKPDNWRQPDTGSHLRPDPQSPVDDRLHAAARANDLDALKELLGLGLDPDQLNIGGLSPLHRAAWPGHLEAAGILLEAGADPNVEDSTGGTPVHIAVLNGRSEFVRTLVAGGADVNKQDKQGITALARAAQNGHLETVRTLLDLGADPAITDHAGWTTLHWAASSPRRNAIPIMELLLGAGVYPDAKDDEGLTPLHVAAMNLVNHQPGRPGAALDPFVNVRRLQTLLAAGANVNEADKQGRTALHWAAWIGETQYGEDRSGRPFFRYRTEALQYLLAAGADPQAIDHHGKQAADYAGKEGYQEAEAYLRQSGEVPWLGEFAASANASMEQPGQEQFLLNQAIEGGNLGRIRQLLESGLDPNLPAPDGSLPLHLAVIGGNAAAVRLLLESGADPGIRDTDGYQPIDRAIQNQQPAIADLLRQHGGKP